MRRPNRPSAVLAIAAAALVLAACGSDDDDTSIPQTGGGGGTEANADESPFPATIEAANGEVMIPARPERIVSLSATATEMLYAIEAGDQVVAVDDQSDYPEGVPATDLSGYEPNAEAIVGYEPDLVVVHFDANDIVAALERLAVPVVELPAAESLDQTYDQIAQLGAATGHDTEAAELVEQMQADIEDLAADVPDRPAPLTYYHELDDQLHTATSNTFIGQIYELAGLENVADPADDGSGYPQVSAELLFEADPDLIFLADTTDTINAQTVAGRAGWNRLSAVRNQQVIELDPDTSSRWGPRTVEFLSVIIDATADVDAGAAAA